MVPDPKINRRRWDDAIGRSDLTVAERHMCWVLMVWTDLQAGVCWPSVGSIAFYSGYDQRSVRRILRRLERKGVLMYPKRSRGGPRATHRYQLVLAALEARGGRVPNPDPGSGLNPDPRGAQPGPAIPLTLTGDTANPDPGSGEHPLEEPNEPPPQPPADGGGGGPLAARERGEEPSEEDVRAAEDALLDSGVSRANARELARTYGFGVVAAGIEWVRQSGGEPDSPAAILVTILRDGTARDAYERAERAKVVAREAAARSQRIARLEELRRWTFSKASPERLPAVQKGWRLIERVWSKPEQITDSGVLPDAELLAERIDGWVLFDKLAAAAKARLNQKPGSAGGTP